MSIENISVQYLKGVGEKTAKRLHQHLGIKTVADLFYYFPRDWEDRSQLKSISELKAAESVTIRIKVKGVSMEFRGKHLVVFKAKIFDSTGVANAIWFRHYTRRYDVLKPLKDNITAGTEIFITGTVEGDFWEKTLNVLDHEVVADKDIHCLINTNRIVPVYPLTEKFTNKFLRTAVNSALNKYSDQVTDNLPEKYLKKYNLCGIKFAIKNIHFPENFESKDTARRRLAFNEFLNIGLVIEQFRQKIKKAVKNYRYTLTKRFLTSFKNNLPFEFTGAQKKVINEIFENMLSPAPMNRLLQGDVGSGKTVVALSAMLLAVESGYQSVLLAPTEILAEQHFLTIQKLLKGLNVNPAPACGSGVKVELVIGKMPKKKKTDIKHRISSGQSNIIIGTHAVLEKDIKFKNLSLVVIDEQHRFGVEQRLQMKKKSIFNNVDLLMMTATPIPRTLGLTVYGDLDISTLDELPPGRCSIKTLEMTEEKAYNFVKERIKQGEQAFIVYPLVDEQRANKFAPTRRGGLARPLKSAIKEAENLRETEFKNLSVGLIHGRMKPEEKDKIMLDFANRVYDILISTTVIEVGIDIPNATVMILEHADRYGLSTLHQLRGRVGRSSKESFCILLGEAKTEDAKKRLNILITTNDGFKIAEEDLRIRGPGEFLGTEQSGIPDFKIGNILTDFGIIQEAKQLASEIIRNDPALLNNIKKNPPLRVDFIEV